MPHCGPCPTWRMSGSLPDCHWGTEPRGAVSITGPVRTNRRSGESAATDATMEADNAGVGEGGPVQGTAAAGAANRVSVSRSPSIHLLLKRRRGGPVNARFQLLRNPDLPQGAGRLGKRRVWAIASQSTREGWERLRTWSRLTLNRQCGVLQSREFFQDVGKVHRGTPRSGQVVP